MNNDIKVFHQSYLEPVLTLIPLGFAYFIIIHFNIGVFWSVIITALIGLAIAIYYYYTFKTIIVDPTSLTIKDRDYTKEILWEDIVSMATVNTYNKQIKYQIRTKNGESFTLPIMNNFPEFEQLVSKYAHLETAGIAMQPNVFYINSPKIQRWHKTGDEYKTTSGFDILEGIFYPKTWKSKKFQKLIKIWNILFFVIFTIVILKSLSII